MATKDRGFASMNPQKQKKIAQKGGKAISKNREYMASIGKKGGLASAKARMKKAAAKKARSRKK